MFNLSLEEFTQLAKEYNVIPLYREFLADLENPLSAFLKIRDLGRFPFLLESVIGGEKWARYSFLGYGGSFYIKTKKNFNEIYDRAKVSFGNFTDPLEVLKPITRSFKPFSDPKLPRFWGGLVRYIGYDTVKFWEPVPDQNPDPLGVPDIFLVRSDLVIIFDNLTSKLTVVKPVVISKGDDPKELYFGALGEIEKVIDRLKAPSGEQDFMPVGKEGEVDFSQWNSNFSKEEFEGIVSRAKKYIEAGDII